MMEGVLSPSDKESMVSSFLEIAVGQTVDTATQFLQATSWKLEEAIQLFYIGNEGGTAASSIYSPPLENDRPLADQSSSQLKEDIGDENGRQADGNEVRAPIPVRREVLYDNAIPYGSRVGYSSHEAHSVVPFRNFTEEMKRPGIWESEQGATSTADNAPDNLATLYRPPFALMHNGTFEAAKDAAKIQDKWFLVNVQSNKEFSSHMLNRDTWANEAVSQTISNNFIFWQVYDDTEEGRKVCTYYKLDSIPVILVIDPITGQKMRSWRGMVQPESLLEDLLPFMDGSPKDHHVSLSHKRPRESSQTSPHKIQDATKEEGEEQLQALAASTEGMKDTSGVASKDQDITNTDKEERPCSPKKPTYPPLPEEAKGDRNLLCRVGVRLPDGRRLQRNFFRTDPIQLLWSFCYAQLPEAQTRPFRLTQAIPGASKFLDYDSKLTFAESGLANSMISVTWE
ncbi:plant UBX domain-containing protein 7 isoform X3 [Camellia sinensis]|uniref:plant UBX domain-containing protein 7 isoform X3 n=1 Tax=Camellia sinensis TaxID=4442 RepID=UPI00103602B4|nr:plant UBX domain-containing protein 7 isoform X3 [Camellia sinensis]